MKIGIVGGTGEIGEGMAMRLSPIFDVIVGSRELCRAEETCEISSATLQDRGIPCMLSGACNQEAVTKADIVILAIPFNYVEKTLNDLSGFENKIVISPINPLKKTDHFMYTPPKEGSAAQLVKKLLPESARLCTAFNNIAGNRWKAISEEIDYSVAVCSDDTEAKSIVMEMIDRVSLLKAYDAGPLEASSIVESVTPLLLNIAKFNKMKDVGVNFK